MTRANDSAENPRPRDDRHRHFDEITALLFLEGRLDRDTALQLSSHAADCAACAAILSSLELESAMLSQALIEEDEPLPARLRNAPSPSPAREPVSVSWVPWAHWAWALSFVLAAAACYLAWTDFFEPWADRFDQAGIQTSSLLIRMAVSGAFWEGWSNVLNTSLFAVAISMLLGLVALLSLSSLSSSPAAALSTLSSLRKFPRYRGPATLALSVAGLALLLGLPAPAAAADIRRGPEITVPAGQTLQNDLIAAGRSVRIDGTVNGDLIAFSQDVTVNGHVTGDVIAFGDAIRVAGQVDGNIRCFCNTLTLDATVGKNVTAFAQRVELNSQSAVNGGLIAFARNVIASGKVNRDLLLFVADTSLNGTVGGNVLLRGGQLSVGPSAAIAGDLRVTSNVRPEVAAGASLGRPLEFQLVRQPRRRLAGLYFLRLIVGYGVAFLCGFLLIKLFPGLFVAGEEATHHAGLAMSIGALALISAIALMIFSIMLLIAGAAAGFAAAALYFPVLYGSQIFVGVWIGEKLLRRTAKLDAAIGPLAIGLLVFRLLGLIPFLGFFVWAAALIWGTGAICMALWTCTRPEPTPAATPLSA